MTRKERSALNRQQHAEKQKANERVRQAVFGTAPGEGAGATTDTADGNGDGLEARPTNGGNGNG